MMRHSTNLLESSQGRWSRWGGLLASAFSVGIMLSAGPVYATESQAPWECSGYSGDAHTRCLQAYIEIQREKLAKLEGEMQVQRGAVGQLKEQVDRQASANTELQRNLAERSYAVSPVAPVYAYPPVGFSFSLGSPWYYGAPYYGYGYRPYIYGPRFFYHRHGPWRH